LGEIKGKNVIRWDQWKKWHLSRSKEKMSKLQIKEWRILT
jgi:hypothetical protein